MSTVTLDSDGDGVPETQLDYEYDDSGIRVAETKTVDGNADGDFVDPEDTSARTDYLVDHQNPTGYAQVLEERVDGELSKSYTLGLDVLAQALALSELHHFLYDGHGSTRGLVDATGQPLTGQIYRYDAYGNPIGFDSSTALTTLLYSGEQTDQLTGLQYLRARYYDLATGRFNRLDPFFGNRHDPQSLHKYVFCHGDGINFSDPTGRWGVVATIVTVGIVSGGIAAAVAYFGFGYTAGQSAVIGVGVGLGVSLWMLGLPLLSIPAALPFIGGATLLTTEGLGLLAFIASGCFGMNLRHRMDRTLSTKLRDLAPSTADDAEADRIAAAIKYTYDRNWRLDLAQFLPRCGQKSKGYYCYEWAYAFEDAFRFESTGSYFEAEVQNAKCTDGRVHFWVKITSRLDPASCLYVDDGFWNGNYVHYQQPCGGPYVFSPIIEVPRETSDNNIPPAYNGDGEIPY